MTVDSTIRPIPSLPHYLAADTGHVYSIRSGKWLKPERLHNGYLRLFNPPARRKVHDLIAEAFYGPRPSSGHVVNHKNAQKDDNRASNLEWATNAENRAHASALGLLKHKLKGSHRLTWDEVREIRRLSPTHSNLALAKMFNVTNTMVGYIVTGRYWRERS